MLLRGRPQGYLWATDTAAHSVFQLEVGSGKVLLQLGTGRPGSGAASFNAPTDVAVNPRTDEVYISDGYGNSRIAVFTYTGKARPAPPDNIRAPGPSTLLI